MPLYHRGKAILGAPQSLLTAGSTAATLPFSGNVVIFSTAAGKQHTLATPSGVGATVSIFCRRATTTLTARVKLPSGWSFQRTSNSTGATHRQLQFNAGNQGVSLVAISTAKVAFLSNTNSVTVTTT